MMRTSELTGAALDWAVAKCEGYTDLHKIDGRMAHEPQLGMYPPRRAYGVMDLFELGFSTDWSLAGPIIEREKIGIITDPNDANVWIGSVYEPDWRFNRTGPTPLIAAMRCYVASKLGETIDIPEELTP
jgi:hypothetical protein